MKNLWAILILSAVAFGQAVSTSNPIVINQNGTPVPNVLVSICTINPGTGVCPSLATTYTDQSLGHACSGSGQPLNAISNPSSGASCSNPGYTDGLGNVIAFSTAALYWCQYSSPSIGTATVPCPFGPASVITVAAGETIAHAVARLPVGGGVVQVPIGTFAAGGVDVSIPNVAIVGSGRGQYNSLTNPTGYTAGVGTVIQGTVRAHQGADLFQLRNLSVDVGSNWVTNVNSGIAVDGIDIYNSGQTVGAPRLQGVVIDNVSCLGSSINALNHCMLVENVDGATINNVQTELNEHGLIIKGVNVNVTNTYHRGHGNDAIIIKSDNYAPTCCVNIANAHITYLATPGDTKGIIIQSVNGGNINYVKLSNVDIVTPLAFGVFIQGTDVSDQVLQVEMSNIDIDGQNAAGTIYCWDFTGFVGQIDISNFHCSNISQGAIPISTTGFNDVNWSNGTFTNISTIALETLGRTSITGVHFLTVTGNAIQTDAGGVSTLRGIVCNNIGGLCWASSGGGINIPEEIVASLVTTAAASDTVSVPGMTSTGHCTVTPTNSGAAGGIASVFVSAKASNQITVSHTATANWNFDIACVPY